MATGNKQRLSREAILGAAQGIVEEEGLDSLSMRRLAQRLDVWPMSIYTYFRDKDELLDALAESAVERVNLPSGRASWRNQLKALLHEARRVLGSDQSGLASRLPRAMLSPGLLKLSEAGLGILAGAGFGTKDAAGAWRALLSYTFGFATTSLPARDTRMAIAALPDDEHPALDALAAALAADEEFDRGLDLLLEGLAARATTG
jgi:AcrR family transcriptional regulator